MTQHAPEITLGEIARRLEATLDGDPARVVRAIAPLEHAGPDAVSWLGGEKYASQLATTRAAAVITREGVAVPDGLAAIRVADPDLAVCTVLEALAPPVPRIPTGTHPAAVVDPTAQTAGAAIGPHVYVGPGAHVGAGTQLHPGVYVGANARVGENCVLWANVVLREHCIVGDRVHIHPNSTIGADGFGYLFRDGKHRKIPQIGIVVIEDDVEIGANSAIDRARSGGTRVGRGTKIDNLVQIAHNCRIGHDSILVAQVGISGSCTLGHHVVLAGQVGVADHVKIGDGVRIGAQAGAAADAPAGATLLGSPAQDAREALRQVLALKRLPKLMEQVRELSKRVERIEPPANDQG
ncbi:MAG: UDP-3-O-(3-hydroxymyristoyl)glucosamine N-acyltransferase [Planctomycetes bacterium]|nr:UDP-3-O-(3-hydroxymyristoyl)glucosamine N-acyltransferase [Planctomycetota bacterium]